MENINVRAAFIHVLGDLLQSVGVIIAAIIIKIKPEWGIVDPICTFLFSVIVLFTTFGISKDCIRVLMEGTPTNVNITRMRTDIENSDPSIVGVHDLHVWGLNMGKAAMSCHIDSTNPMKSLKYATRIINRKYKILHTTIQVEQTFDSQVLRKNLDAEPIRFSCDVDH